MPLLANGVGKLEGATEDPLKVGDKALDFKRKDQTGKTVSLSDFAGTPVVLFLVGGRANGLTGQRLEKFTAIAAQLRGAGYQPLVLANNYFEANRELAEQYQADYPILDDESNAYEALATYEQPTDAGTDYPLYFLAADHTIEYIKSGDEFLAEDSVDDVLGVITRPAARVIVPRGE
jgi:peroxiredoxin